MAIFFRRKLEALSDLELLKNRKEIGDKRFWEEVYRRYGHYLSSVISYKYPDFRESAEDIVQETFLRMAFEDMDNIKNLKAFLATTAAHICIDRHRHRNAKKRADSNMVALDAEMGHDGSDDSFLEITENTESLNPEEEALKELQIEEYRRILSQLPEECQKMLMFSAEGMKYKEIAKLMDLPIGTVGTKLLRCREKLKTILEQEIDESSLNLKGPKNGTES
ncbi:MAG TPA: RNA polymerase sigma factor [Thermotogota bacterium]|nr:RNA polymerase sigma factor [Thermotogota bacterium]HRW91979.1 RNA polymerase sigma factor [Thermotogota bacterium]